MDLDALASMSPEEKAAYMNELLEGPALAPPPGVVPDFQNPGGSHSLGYGIVILSATLATITILLRVATRYSMRKIHIEDAFLLAAYGLFGGHLYLLYDLAIFPGVQVHMWNLQLKYLSRFLLHVHVHSAMYGFTITCLKITILLDWLRLFVPRGQRNTIFWASHILIWLNAIFYVIGSLIEIFRCTPHEKIWNPFFEGGHCPIDIQAANVPSGAMNLVSDLVILALPQCAIWKLHMTRERKLGISLLFTIGILLVSPRLFELLH
ncbi:hypothetical protein DL770_010862 [Monosporascus sp. CRB-9-2]|nr:hypothetical protein DL770_010862 [Monosporascus sp. CRB-9-2]